MTKKFKGNADKLTSEEIYELKELIPIIVNTLSCNISSQVCTLSVSSDEEDDDGFPCLTCRTEGLDAMKQFIKIHG